MIRNVVAQANFCGMWPLRPSVFQAKPNVFSANFVAEGTFFWPGTPALNPCTVLPCPAPPCPGPSMPRAPMPLTTPPLDPLKLFISNNCNFSIVSEIFEVFSKVFISTFFVHIVRYFFTLFTPLPLWSLGPSPPPDRPKMSLYFFFFANSFFPFKLCEHFKQL